MKTSSTWLLLRTMRRGLVGWFAVVAFTTPIFVFLPSDVDIPRLLGSFALSFIAWRVLAYRNELEQLPFPVTDRQLAWIPLGILVAMALAGLFGIACYQGAGIVSGRLFGGEVFLFWAAAARWAPVICFLSVLGYRSLQINMGFVWIFPIFLSQPAFLRADDGIFLISGKTISACLDVWSLWLVCTAFLIWELPFQAAVLRRLTWQAVGAENMGSRQLVEYDAPANPSFGSRVLDGLTALGIAGLAWFFFGNIVFIILNESLHSPYVLFFLIFYVPLRWLCLALWRAARASGLGPWQAAAMVLLELTGVGYTFRDKLGIGRGKTVRCPICGQWHFAWQEGCGAPDVHKDLAEETTAEMAESAAFQEGKSLRTVLWPQCDQGASMFRGVFPLQVLAMVLIFNWRHWFGG